MEVGPLERDLPVAVQLPSPLGRDVVAYLEGEVGWQVVGLDGPLRPALLLAAAPVPGWATVVLVEGPVDGDRVRACLRAGAVDVLSWPDERDHLPEAAARAAALPPPAGGPPLLRVAGVAGGAGASTVALALAGLLAWSGREVITVGGDDLAVLAGLAPWRGPGAAEVGGLDARDAAVEVDALARAVPGVARLRVLGGGAVAGAVSSWPVDAVVTDLRLERDTGCEVLCARPDTHLRALAGTAGSQAVVLVGDGPLPRRAVRRALGRDPAAWLPASARVARAGVRGRVPADLPGAWLRALRPVLSAVRIARRP